MAIKGSSSSSKISHVKKRTSQGGRTKTSSMNKGQKRGFKPSRGQG